MCLALRTLSFACVSDMRSVWAWQPAADNTVPGRDAVVAGALAQAQHSWNMAQVHSLPSHAWSLPFRYMQCSSRLLVLCKHVCVLLCVHASSA